LIEFGNILRKKLELKLYLPQLCCRTTLQWLTIQQLQLCNKFIHITLVESRFYRGMFTHTFFVCLRTRAVSAVSTLHALSHVTSQFNGCVVHVFVQCCAKHLTERHE